MKNYFSFNINSLLLFENTSVINLFKKQLNQDKIDKILLLSIEKKCQRIVKYFFTTLIKDSFKLTIINAQEILTSSIAHNCLFDYLINQITSIFLVHR